MVELAGWSESKWDALWAGLTGGSPSVELFMDILLFNRPMEGIQSSIFALKDDPAASRGKMARLEESMQRQAIGCQRIWAKMTIPKRHPLFSLWFLDRELGRNLD